MKYIYQITLKSVLLLENGMKENAKGHNLLSFTLVYPREGIMSMETIKKLSLKKRKTLSLKNTAFSDKLLFKESIQGDSSLIINLTAIEEASKIKSILNQAGQSGILVGLSAIPGGMGMSIITAVAKNVINSIFDMAQPKDKLTILGQIDFPINQSNLKNGELTLHLTVPKKTIIKERRIRNGKRVLSTKTLKKGLGIGKVILDVTRIEL